MLRSFELKNEYEEIAAFEGNWVLFGLLKRATSPFIFFRYTLYPEVYVFSSFIWFVAVHSKINLFWYYK